MENLTIISTSITVQAKQEINGNTANFAWNHNQGELPQAVNFNVQRGLIGEPSYTGNAIISGAFYTQSGKFDVQNNNFQDGDLEVYAEILNVCKAITQEIENLAKTNASEK